MGSNGFGPKDLSASIFFHLSSIVWQPDCQSYGWLTLSIKPIGIPLSLRDIIPAGPQKGRCFYVQYKHQLGPGSKVLCGHSAEDAQAGLFCEPFLHTKRAP